MLPLAEEGRLNDLPLRENFIERVLPVAKGATGPTAESQAFRLVRDLPVGSLAWKRLYHRARNASEARNATFEHWHLKRLPVYGGLRGKALSFLADT